MKPAEYFETLADCWEDQLVVCALGESVNGWWAATGTPGCHSATFYHYGMGFASSFGLGLALALPDQEVWVLDTDGGYTMNLGGVLTEASTQPGNLLHIVLDNHGYQSLGGAAIVNSERSDYAAIARAAGIANAATASTPEELATLIRAGSGLERHGLIVADVEPWRETDLHNLDPGAPLPFEGQEIKYRFGRHIEAKTGRTVFGPRGY